MTRILVVEDSPTQAQQLQLILEAERFAVDVAANAEIALQRFADQAFDMIISDIMMPGLSGYELCERIKQDPRGHNIPVVLLSTLIDPMDIIRGLECGADNFITKPYEPEQLVDRIRTVFQNRRARTQGKLAFGVEVMFLGRKFVVNSEKEQILDLLIATFEDIVRTNRGLQESKAELVAAKAQIETYALELEHRVEERTEQLVEQQQQLAQAQKVEAVGQLTGGIAHDFNNILTVIIGTTEILAEAVAHQPELAELAAVVDAAAQRGAELTQHLLAFARKQALHPRAIDTNELVISTAKLLRPTLGENIEIESMLDENAWPALVDPGQLTTAIVNLAVNARDAMPNGGKLTLETGNVHLDEAYAETHRDVSPGAYAMVAVSDNGTGIPAAIRDKVFDPFFTTKEVGKGTGLGLSMVYGFVKQSGGHIKIYCEDGHGTCIRIYLPRAAGPDVETIDVAVVAPALGGTEKILVVEDDAMVRNYVMTHLVGLGYRAIPAANADEALVLIDQGIECDLLFTDIIMSGNKNGRDLADEVVRRRPEVRVLYTSGYTQSAIVHNGRLDPGVLLLTKPYRRSDLAQMIRVALNGARPGGSRLRTRAENTDT
jgi:signal transduction histidine kinase